jgi:Protein of unknown function (DUF1616)
VTASLLEIFAGLLLVFALPGYAITKATFPEWRLQGPEALLRAVEIGTLSLVLSVAVTILVGFVLGVLPGNYFLAGWSDPLLETVLAAITGIGLVAAVLRGAFHRLPPSAPATEPDPGEEAPFALTRALEADRREARRLRHAIRALKADDPQRSRLEEELLATERRTQERLAAREAEYAR